MKGAIVGIAIAIVFANQAEAKVYAAGVAVQSVAGSGCLDSAGKTFAGVLKFAGLTGTTAALRIPFPSLGAVSTQIPTTTSGAGTAHPSGTFTWKGQGATGTVWNVSGTFQATITTVDANSYVTENSFISATSLKPK